MAKDTAGCHVLNQIYSNRGNRRKWYVFGQIVAEENGGEKQTAEKGIVEKKQKKQFPHSHERHEKRNLAGGNPLAGAKGDASLSQRVGNDVFDSKCCYDTEQRSCTTSSRVSTRRILWLEKGKGRGNYIAERSL
jgi:hypothetical protein